MSKQIFLPYEDRVTKWYNVLPDIPNGLQPPLDPENNQPVAPEKLGAIFPPGLLEQEMSEPVQLPSTRFYPVFYLDLAQLGSSSQSSFNWPGLWSGGGHEPVVVMREGRNYLHIHLVCGGHRVRRMHIPRKGERACLH